MAQIGVLGMGAMGSRMAKRLLAAGHQVSVWNRDPAKALPLAEQGAQVATSPVDAVREADAVIAMLRDDIASAQVWSGDETGALAAMRPGALAIESSTLTPGRVRDWAQAALGHGIVPVEAPVSGSLPQAEAGQLVYFLGGEADPVARAAALLAPLGLAFPHVGAAGDAAVVKLVTNTLLAIQVGAWAELLPMMAQQGLNLDTALGALAKTSAWAPVSGYLTAFMRAGQHQPLFPVEMLAKDLGYALGLPGAPAMPLASQMQQRFAAAIEAGLGGSTMTALITLARSR